MVSLIEEEYETFTRERKWKQIFDRIQNEATILYNSPAKYARLPENRERNRYRDVSPYDEFRVHLDDCANNYINASYVQVPLAGRKYILTQGPLANTSGHFWLMIWQQNTKGVLMLNKVIEDGRLKCHPYFPMGAEYGGTDCLTYEDVNIKVEHISVEDQSYFVIRTLKLVHMTTGDEKIVLQFHYIDWPDFGIPKNSESFLSFLYAVRQSGVIPSRSSEDSKATLCGPPVIHCSAGIGRSGTFCLVDSALVLVERTKSLSSLDICSMLIDMRKYRCGLIQRPEQLQFSYMAILDGAHTILSCPESSPNNDDESMDQSEASEEDSSLDNVSDDELDDELEVVDNINKNAIENGPAPPLRTSSLSNDQDNQHTIEATRNTDMPEPPKRTSSLHKSTSLDEYPPPVPPRPPSTFDRQVSAPPIPEARSINDKENTVYDEDSEYGYENTMSARPIGMYKNAMKRKREEKNKKTKEMVETMVAKQRAAEAAKHWPSYLPSRTMLVGAGLAVLFAFGVMYCRSSIL